MNTDNIKNKIAALLKINAENGSTEAEAITAMEMVQKLMEKYSINMDDVNNETEALNDFIRKNVNTDTSSHIHYVDKFVTSAIGRYTDTKAWISKRGKGKPVDVFFFGYSVDVELAGYIREVCKRAMITEWDKFKVTIPKNVHKRTEMKSFMYGMGSRLAKRLDEMKVENSSKVTSKQLVVIKKDLVERAFQDEGIELRSLKTKIRMNQDSYSAGQAAGDKVKFTRGIQNGPAGGTKMIAAG